MDEFLQLNWSRKYPRPLTTRRDVYSCGFSDDESDVFVCHMNEIDPEFYGKFEEDAKLPGNGEQRDDSCQASSAINSPPKNASLQMFGKFPTKSKMKKEIHMTCLRFLKKLEEQEECTESQLTNDKDQKGYLSCEAVRKQEKMEFHEFVKNHFQTYLRHRILKIDVDMESILIGRWKRWVEDVKQRRHQNYQLQTALPLDHRTGTEVNLVAHEEIHRSCIAPMMCDLSAQEIVKLEQSPEKLKSYLHDNPGVGGKSEIIVEELVLRNECDFLIPLEAIEVLVNGANSAWNIPFRVEESGSRKVGFIELPLPPLSVDTKHRNSEILKYCFEMEVLQQRNESLILDRGNSNENVKETPKNSPESDSDGEEQLFIDDPDEEVPDVQSEREAIPKAKEVTPEESLNIEENQRGQKRAESNVFRGCTLSSGSDTCKLLVKIHEDGSVSGDEECEAVNFSIKIEYQAEFGAEEMTLEELIREWCLQTFHPGSRTLRIRIDSQSLKILSVKEVSLKKVERDMDRLHGITSQDLLQKLCGILTVMKNFPGQDYLMHHEVSHGNKLMIYVSRDSGEPDKNFLQLSRIFENVEFNRKPLLEQHDWHPIDDQEVTLLHERAGVMPCAFPHWGKAGNTFIWNEKKNLVQKYEARMKAKKESRELHEKRLKSEKNRARHLKRQRKKEQQKQKKAQEGTEKFAKILSNSGGTTVPDWFFDENGRVRIHKDP